MTSTEPHEVIQPGAGPWSQAWRRLRKHRLAMAGLVIVVVVAFTATLAPWVAPFDPEDMERWTGALPPGSRHLEVRNEMLFSVGAAPRRLEVPQRVARTLDDGHEHVLRLTMLGERVVSFRITVDGAKVRQIQQITGGAKRVPRIETAPGEVLRAKDGPRLPADAIETGGDLPPGLPPHEGAWVLMLEHVTRPPDASFALEVHYSGDGTATRVTTAGTERADEIRVRGEDVVDATFDGERLEHLHPLGTDQEGRDTLTRVIYGGRISLLIGVTATLVSLFVGVLYGATAAYLGGRADVVMMRIVDVLYALPYIFLVILLLVIFDRSVVVLFLGLGLVQWLTPSRVVRGQVLSLKRREFVEAARTLGAGGWTILRRHLIPNTLGVVVVFTTLTIPAVILEESFLSFIGLTVSYQVGEEKIPLESWGALVDYGRQVLGADGERWWLLVCPAVAMSLTLFSLNFLGDGLRDALDPQQRGRR